MAESIQAHMEELRASIEGLEAQRGLLGKKIINPAIETLSQKLAQLNQQADSSQEGHQGQAGLPAEDRRMGTVLFTDMVDSTGIGEKLDLNEAWHLLKMTYFGTMIRPGWTYQTYAEILEALDKEKTPGQWLRLSMRNSLTSRKRSAYRNGVSPSWKTCPTTGRRWRCGSAGKCEDG